MSVLFGYAGTNLDLTTIHENQSDLGIPELCLEGFYLNNGKLENYSSFAGSTEQKKSQLICLHAYNASLTNRSSQGESIAISENCNILTEGVFSFPQAIDHTTATQQFSTLLKELREKNIPTTAALSEITKQAFGTYAFLLVDKSEPTSLYAACKSFPLYLGISSNGNFVSSSPTVLLPHTNNIIQITEDSILRITANNWDVLVTNSATTEKKQPTLWDMETATKHGYAHYMLKEVMEQPTVLAQSLSFRLSSNSVHFPELIDAPIPQRIRIIACGSSYHAGLWASKLIEEFAAIPTAVELASEFRYQPSLLLPDETVIFITQSGETADTLAALEKAKLFGVNTISICNVPNASIAKATDYAIYTQAGTEVSIASTKAVTTQMATLLLLALYWGDKKATLPTEIKNNYREQLAKLPQILHAALPAIRETAKIVASSLAKARSMFFIGRGQNYCLALEGALKIKELTYIHAEGYSAGEVRHGPIALVDQNFPTIALAPTDTWLPMTKATIKEIRAQGGRVYAITDKNGKEQLQADTYCIIPDVWEPLNGFTILPVMQLIGYELACILGNNVDQPRSLTKSVQG